jgi:molybdopterin-guanine dinucleotide biosynthesis adapter protein
MTATTDKPAPPPVLGIAGWKNSGKTTLTERLIAELTRRGLRVASVKHAHHSFDIDHAGTDSFRHRAAGAREVAVVSDNRVAHIRELSGAPEPTLHEIVARFAPCDLVIAEGYKTSAVAKIEVRRLEARSQEPLAGKDPHVIAIAADHAVAGAGLPVFRLDDVTAIADFVVAWMGGRP